MLIGNITLTEYGIKLVDVDSSTTELDFQDALKLLTWLTSHQAALIDIKRKNIVDLKRRDRELRKKQEEEESEL